MDESLVFEKLGIALGLGLLVGLQRQRAQSPVAGIRTFGLITVLGAVSALLGQSFGGWVVGLGVLAVALLLVVGNLANLLSEEADPGLTTEIAALVMYGVGAYVVVGHASVAIALGGGVALLLYWKTPLHTFVARIGETDLKAIMRFVLVGLVILPVLPDEGFGPYEVLNPHNIWLMVVLIVGIGLGGYVAYKLFGDRAGTVLGGVLGGLISSTATTVSYARRARQAEHAVRLTALAIAIASATAYVRVLIEAAVAAPGMFGEMAPPLVVMLIWMALICGVMGYFSRGEKVELPPPENPAELKVALIFGVLYALVLLGIAAAADYFGQAGLYGMALLSGLHDLDAITLSTAQLADRGQVAADTGWRVILAASLANLVAKTALVGLIGGRRVLSWILVLFGAALAGGLLLLLLWPAGG
jgi:uncharacterized membrane protein (DUF4010 family)